MGFKMQQLRQVWNDFVDSPFFAMAVTAIVWLIIFSFALFLLFL